MTYYTMNKEKRISAVIFDCDGVMFDSRQANNNFYNHILAHFGLAPMNEADLDMVHMLTAESSINHIFQGSPYLEEAQAFRMEMDYAPFIKDLIIEPGLKDLLRYLKPGYGLAVATNRSNTIGEVLTHFGLKAYFDIVVSSLDVAKPKPHPESIIKILDFFGIEPDACVYIGDSRVDAKTCEAAGIPLIAYRNRDLKAMAHIDALTQVRAIVDI